MPNTDLQGKTIAFLCAPEGTEQIELTEPWEAVEQAGGTPRLVSTQSGRLQAFNHLDKADTFPVDVEVKDAKVDDYVGLVLPGGVANPDHLRMSSDAVKFARAFVDRGKPIAVICHGPWTLVEADVVRDRTLTSWPSIKTDIRNAGGNWVNEEVVVDNGMVTSRKPDDIPAFTQKMIEEIAEGVHSGQRVAR